MMHRGDPLNIQPSTTAGENGRKHQRRCKVNSWGFGVRDIEDFEAHYTPTEKETLTAYEGVQAALEMVGTEAQLLLEPQLPVQGSVFKESVPSTHHTTDATRSKWGALITEHAPIGNPSCPGILEVITD